MGRRGPAAALLHFLHRAGRLLLLMALALAPSGAAPARAEAQAPAAAPSPAVTPSPEDPAAKAERLRGRGVIVLVIDNARAVREAQAARQAQEQFLRSQRATGEAAEQQEGALRAEAEALSRRKGEIPDADLGQRLGEIENRIYAARAEAREQSAAAERRLDQALDRVSTQMLEVVAQIAKEKDAWLVLSSSQVILFETTLNITDETIKRLDAVLPSVPDDPQP